MALPRAPPEMMDDATGEILLRLPPSDPACLVRASLVCKPWRRVLSDPAFSRRYREFHRTPPLLGFFPDSFPSGDEGPFVATTAFPFPRPSFDCAEWWGVDCRHGRALLHSSNPCGVIVWDPITNDRQYIRLPKYSPRCSYHAAAVLCTADGCNHLNCYGGPFIVVLNDEDERFATQVRVFSSETGAWSAPTTVQFNCCVEQRAGLFTGDALYFALMFGRGFLKYDLAGQGLSVIQVPDEYIDWTSYGMVDEHGGLGFVAAVRDNLHLWSWQAGPDGVVRWVRGRVIELKMLLPDCFPFVTLR